MKRTAVFPVKNFGSQLAPFYTILPLFVGSLLMAVTLKPGVSRRNREGLDNPKPHQLFLGHYGVFGVIALLQSTFSLGGGLLFLHIQAVHPWLFMLTGWVASLVFSFFTYTMVASFGNVGKAIGVLTLVLQISARTARIRLPCCRRSSAISARSCRPRMRLRHYVRPLPVFTTMIIGMRSVRCCCS